MWSSHHFLITLLFNSKSLPCCRIKIVQTSLQITLIAKVVNVTENATYLDMQVEDGTGRLDVKFYVDNEEDNAVRFPKAKNLLQIPEAL